MKDTYEQDLQKSIEITNKIYEMFENNNQDEAYGLFQTDPLARKDLSFEKFCVAIEKQIRIKKENEASEKAHKNMMQNEW